MAVPWDKILTIIILILELIREGMSEKKAIDTASKKTGIPSADLTGLFKKYKDKV